MTEDFAAYVGARRPRLVRAAVLLGCSVPDAEDIVQVTLAKAHRSWRRIELATNPDAYVHRMLLNALHDSRRRRWRGEVATAELPDLPVDHDLADGLVVRRALAALRHEHREVLVLRYYVDLSEAATAEALGVAAGTVKSRTARALAALEATPEIISLTTERST